MTVLTTSLLQRMAGALLRWAAEQRRREDDARYWQAALHDPRLMADINCARARAEGESPAQPVVVPAQPRLSALIAASHALSH